MNKKGITFVEVMVSILIFGLVFSSVLSVMVMRREGVKIARDHESALRRIQQRVEGIKNMAYADVLALGSYSSEDITLNSGITGTLATTVIDNTTYAEVDVNFGWVNRSMGGVQYNSQSLATIVNE